MPSDRPGAPWAGATYNGFSGPALDGAPQPAPSQPDIRPAPAHRFDLSRKTLILGGVAAAVVLGLAMGLWSRPNIGPDGHARDPMSSAAEAATQPAVPIEVNRPQPLPTPKAAGRMEVLPTDMAQAARASAPSMRPRVAAIGDYRDTALVAPPQVEDPPEVRWAPPEPRLSRAERRALREQRWGEDPGPRFDPRAAPDDMPPPDDGDRPSN